MPEVQLTPRQQQQWDSTTSLMIWAAPGFRHLFLKLLTNKNHKEAVFTTDVPIAATDGMNILINPDTFFQQSLKARVLIIAHEVMHNVYKDCTLMHHCHQTGKVKLLDGTELPYDKDVMNKAMDYRINALLVDSKIGEMPVDPQTGKMMGCLDPKIGSALDGVLDIYPKVYKKKKQQEDMGQDFDELMPPGSSMGLQPDDPKATPSEKQWRIEISTAKALEAQKVQGKASADLMRIFKDILEPEVPWQEKILAFMSRRVGGGTWNWRNPDHQMIERDLYMPSRSGKNAGWLVVWGDTSGSIGVDELNRYMAELGGILDQVHPHRLTVVWCDSQIKRIDELEDMGDLEETRYKGAPGGGSTSVHPVLDWIADQHDRPEMFLAFTDGYVTFPHKIPPYPVLWCSTTDTKYPFGDVVRIKT